MERMEMWKAELSLCEEERGRDTPFNRVVRSQIYRTSRSRKFLRKISKDGSIWNR